MIFKVSDFNNNHVKNKNFFLFYGINQGLKDEIIDKYFKKNFLEETYKYDENQILADQENFFNNILSKSFFSNKKLIIIEKTTDKLLTIINEIIEKDTEDTKIILKSNILEKKSKIRNFFEKNNKTLCLPFYEDNAQTLNVIAQNFLRKKSINISQQNINIIIERSKGDRINLKNELAKIENFSKTKKKIDTNDILKLTNLAENYNINDLVDNSLSKNKKKTLNILNENNFGQEDIVLILRVYLSKLKRLTKLHAKIKEVKSIDTAIASFKPPIFWKEKENVKKQINNLNYKDVQGLINDTNKIELMVKKNPGLAINIFTNFILEQTLGTNS